MDLVITGVGWCDKPVAYIEKLRDEGGMGLKAAKDAFGSLCEGCAIRIGPLDAEEAARLQKELAEQGAVCAVE